MSALRTTIITKVINAPLRFTFSWLTDYQESDPALIASKRRRIILDRSKKRVVFVGLLDEDEGNTHVSVYDVKLKPPDGWHYDIFDSDRSGTGDYKLKRLSSESTGIRIIFKNRYKNSARVDSAKEYSARLSEHWDKYVAALEADYSSSR